MCQQNVYQIHCFILKIICISYLNVLRQWTILRGLPYHFLGQRWYSPHEIIRAYFWGQWRCGEGMLQQLLCPSVEVALCWHRFPTLVPCFLKRRLWRFLLAHVRDCSPCPACDPALFPGLCTRGVTCVWLLLRAHCGSGSASKGGSSVCSQIIPATCWLTLARVHILSICSSGHLFLNCPVYWHCSIPDHIHPMSTAWICCCCQLSVHFFS